jgi:hypothetical protein
MPDDALELNFRLERPVPPLAKWKAEFDRELYGTLLDFTLSLTPWERICENDKTLRLLKTVQQRCLSNRLYEY